MTRNLKALGLSLLAVFAMSAIAASASQAEEGFFTLGAEGKIHATREQKIGSEVEFFETAAAKLVCESAHYTSATIPVSNKTLTVTPDYTDHTQGGNCRAGGVAKVTVTENGCAYVFHNLKTEPGKTDYTTNVEIECAGAVKAIEIHIERPLVGGSACTVTVPPQTINGTFTVQNMAGTPSDVTISGKAKVKTIQHNGDSTLCGGAETATTEPEVSYTIEESSPLTVTGTSTTGGTNAASLSHN